MPVYKKLSDLTNVTLVEVLSRYWTSSSISARRAYQRLSEEHDNIQEDLEVLSK